MRARLGHGCKLTDEQCAGLRHSLDALPECIHALETFDVTTIRASLPMYLMR